MQSTGSTKHLDLGCGYAPRNPLGQKFLFGCDLLEIDASSSEVPYEYRRVDVVREGIPFPDSFFDSVSAYDFLEHVPRHSLDAEGKPTLPFINLMSEIYRVLIPGGLLLASTPAYPHPAAFQDPTHVNIITKGTHEYFCGKEPYAARYGFKGRFRPLRVAFDHPVNLYDVGGSRLRKISRNLHRRLFKGGISHLAWELIAEK